MRRRSRRGAIVAPLAMAVWCAAAAADPADLPAAPAKSPLSQQELRTTDARIALGNLAAQITGLEDALAANRLSVESLGVLVELLLARGRITGSVEDSEHAALLADRFVREHPAEPDAHIARAQTRAAFHRFADALADLDEAARRGGNAERVDAARATVFQATGRYDAALAIRHRAVAVLPNILTLGAEAAVLAERGDIDQAERLFVDAQNSYRDVSPFPLCWLYTQQGLMWMRAGNLPRARQLLEAAHARLPQDTVVAGHLGWLVAALGERDQALLLLRGAAESGDPSAAADLARVLQYAGRGAEAEQWRERAAARYDELLQRHPEAYLNHAAQFWLGAGGDPQRALDLARRHTAIQPTPISYALLLQAALAAGEPAVACEAATAVLRFGRPTPHDTPLGDRRIAERVSSTCSAP